jgi:hypothetical protein
MNTLFDFLTHIKGVEYVLAISAIVLYMLYWEVLKPKPFRTMMEKGRDDLGYLRETGYRSTLKTVGKVIAAPFIGLAYIVALPFWFAYALVSAIVGGMISLVGREAVFGWRPTEAYLAGKKKMKKKDDEPQKEEGR